MKAVRNRQQLLSRGQVHPGTATGSDTVTETRLLSYSAKNYCLGVYVPGHRMDAIFYFKDNLIFRTTTSNAPCYS